MEQTSDTQKGFALLMVIAVVLILSVLAALTGFLVQRAQKMSSGQMRYSTALEASDAGQDYAAQWITTTSRVTNADTMAMTRVLGSYTVSIKAKLQIIATLAGGDRGMGMGYEGMQGQVNRNAARYYSVNTMSARTGSTVGHETEVGRIETYRRDVIGE